MELDLDPDNIKVHETLLQQILGLLENERIHHEGIAGRKHGATKILHVRI
jgi:hypothetical protein